MEDSLEAQTEERHDRKTRAEAAEAGKTKLYQGEEEGARGEEEAAGGEEEGAGGEEEAAGGEGKSRTMPDGRTATMAARILTSRTKEVEKIQAGRGTTTAASKNVLGLQEGDLQVMSKGEDLQGLPEEERVERAVPTFPTFSTLSTTSSSPTCCPPSGALQRRVHPTSERPCSRDRAHDQVQREPDTEQVHRGLSLR